MERQKEPGLRALRTIRELQEGMVSNEFFQSTELSFFFSFLVTESNHICWRLGVVWPTFVRGERNGLIWYKGGMTFEIFFFVSEKWRKLFVNVNKGVTLFWIERRKEKGIGGQTGADLFSEICDPS